MQSFKKRALRAGALFVPSLIAGAAMAAQQAATPSSPPTGSSFMRAAQGGEPSGWGALSMTGAAAGGIVRSIGTVVSVQTSSQIFLWSALTRQWATVAVSPLATITQFNAYCIIEDGNTVHGYASRAGVVETLQFASPPQVVSGAVSSCWLSIVASGNDVYAFGAFRGEWVHQALTSPSATIQIANMTGYVDDGATVYGVSGYLGTFTPTAAIAGATLEVSGELVVLWSATEAAGYSSHLGTWARRPMTAGAQLALGRGYVLFEDAGEAVAYSPATSTFTSAPMPPGGVAWAANYVCAIEAGADVLAYSSGPNTFVAQTFQGPVSIQTDEEVLVVQDAAGVTGFGVVHAAFSPTLPGNQTVVLGDAVAWAEDGSVGHGYSVLTNTWSAPEPLASGAQSVVLRNIVVVADGQGYHAFSGRTSAWTSIATTVPYDYSGPISGDTFVVFDGARALAFDPTLDRWSEVIAPAPFQALDTFRTVSVGLDAAGRLQGFGLMSHVWSTIVPQGTFIQLDASSSCGYALTSTHLYPFSAHGSLSSLSRFPEFSRIQPLASPLRLLQAAAPGSSVVAILGLRGTYLPGQAYGTLYIDPSSILRRLPLGVVPASGLLDHSLDLSGATALRGTALHVQNFVVPPAGGPWVTNVIAPVIL